MISLRQRMQGFKACALGASLTDKVLLMGYYAAIRINRKFGKTYFSRPRHVFLHYKKAVFAYYIASLDDYRILEEMFVSEQYATDLERPVRTIIDLGANVGASILYFSIQYPEAHIYGFEPSKYTYGLLLKNIGTKASVTLEKKAVSGNSKGTISLYNHPAGHSGSSNFFIKGGSEEQVDTISLDDIVAKYSLDSIDILKIDIEGLEYEVIKHFKGLPIVKYIMVELHPFNSGYSVEDFLALCPNFRMIEKSEGEFSGKVCMIKLANKDLV